MAEQDIDSGKAREADLSEQNKQNAGNLLRDEFLSRKPSLAEQRQADEKSEFETRYQSYNFELDAPQKGWGPFQVLQDMVKQNKIKLNPEEVLSESRRIRDRDFKDWGRQYYTGEDRSQRWSIQEIDQKVQDAAKKVKGIDVSMWQGDVDWKKVKESGIQFTFIRATKGNDLVDPKFEQNRKGSHDVGLDVGYYHYYRPDHPLEDQIKVFVNTVGKVEKETLRLVIDTENSKLWEPFTLEQRLKMIDDWCNGVKKELGVAPEVMIYGSPSFFDETLKNSPQLKKHDLWIANYKVPEPRVPKPWSNWKFWQYSETGRVPGIDGNVDLDMYNGTDLNKDQANKKSHPRKH